MRLEHFHQRRHLCSDIAQPHRSGQVEPDTGNSVGRGDAQPHHRRAGSHNRRADVGVVGRAATDCDHAGRTQRRLHRRPLATSKLGLAGQHQDVARARAGDLLDVSVGVPEGQRQSLRE